MESRIKEVKGCQRERKGETACPTANIECQGYGENDGYEEDDGGEDSNDPHGVRNAEHANSARSKDIIVLGQSSTKLPEFVLPRTMK